MNSLGSFVPSRVNEAPAPGLVLSAEIDNVPRMLRITHMFKRNAYVMPVFTPEEARYAKRPTALLISELNDILQQKGAQLGRLQLPPELRIEPIIPKGETSSVDSAMAIIEPLLTQFENENNLARNRFTSLISQRAIELDISVVTLRRLLLRYYYFGGIRTAVLSLAPGPSLGQKFTTADPTDPESPQQVPRKRSGRQPVEAQELGPNTFVCDSQDIGDMVDCLKTCLKAGPSTLENARTKYLENYFSRRHPERYVSYLAKQCPVPVTARQFSMYIKDQGAISKDLQKNLSDGKKRPGTGTLSAMGPGHVYELDATGGRIHLVNSRQPDVSLATPIIYILIDRWSRFIVSIYVTLRPASWEEIRYALLIAFTPRKRRFKNLGINVSEERWPQGVVPASIAMDRGSEMISAAMLQAAAKDLRVEPLTLPPYCPDGKGIIERLNRELKRKMAQRGIKGVYARRPLDPQSKKASKEARAVSVHSLREIYWELIDIVDDMNNRPHSALRRNGLLKTAGVPPIPRLAYVWGLKNISGIQAPPLTDEDYKRILMGVDKASIANGEITYQNRKYLPANAAAQRMARQSTSRRKQLSIKIDRSDPIDLYVPTNDEDWPLWQINGNGLQEIRDITMDEEECLSGTSNLAWAMAKNDSLIADLKRLPIRKNRQPVEKREVGRAEVRKQRDSESEDIKRGLDGKGRPPKALVAPSQKQKVTWQEIEAQERLEIIERQNKKVK